MTVCNLALICMTTNTINLNLHKNNTKFTVEIFGIPKKPVSSLRIVLSAHPILLVCSGFPHASANSLLLTNVLVY